MSCTAKRSLWFCVTGCMHGLAWYCSWDLSSMALFTYESNMALFTYKLYMHGISVWVLCGELLLARGGFLVLIHVWWLSQHKLSSVDGDRIGLWLFISLLYPSACLGVVVAIH